jgi:cysteine desulfurase
MSGIRTYLDYNATAPMLPSARAAMMVAFDEVGNPSSVHGEGRRTRAVVETSRAQVARLVGAKPSEVVFTSGAAEANATVMAAPWTHVLAAGIEHESVLAGLAREDVDAIEIPCGADGVARLDGLPQQLGSIGGVVRSLACLQLANNETGVIQPVAEIVELARQQGCAVHCDAVQAMGRLPVGFGSLGVDFMSLSAHKIGGPKGIGALVIRDGTSLPALIPGGQERRRRGGTENVAAIAGFGAAAEEAMVGLEDVVRVGLLRDQLEQAIRAKLNEAVVLAAQAPRLANTSCIAIPGLRAETLVIRLDLMGFAVSAGAACSSGKVGTSHVLTAMGVEPALARSAIRISLGRETTRSDIEALIAALGEIAGRSDDRAAEGRALRA